MPGDDTIRILIDNHIAAWNSGNGENVARSYARDARMVMNRGEPLLGRDAIATMAQGFMDEFPGMTLSLDTVLIAGDHAVYAWTFDGVQRGSGRRARFSGWEEWDIGADGTVTASSGWYDLADYEHQLAGETD